MIRYSITPEELRARIEEEAPGWLADAAQRTERFRRAGRYDEASGNWSRIKKVYMRLQHNKCAYCERDLTAEDFGGAIEHDVEHYRPKSQVRSWPTDAIARERNIEFDFPTGEEFAEGYYLLAYHVFNYLASCKKCNTPLKSDFFPIAGSRMQGDDPALLVREEPFLPYPIGNLDDDPEEILTFAGISPIPKADGGPRLRRALVTIKLLELDRREELWRGRARVLVMLFLALQKEHSENRAVREIAAGAARSLLSPASPHTNCARAFRALYETDPTRAEELARAAQEYLDSQS
jgi:hypothetical protein